MLEPKTATGGVWAFMQIVVGVSNAPVAPPVTRGKRIVVDLQSQTVEAFDGPSAIYRFDCVTAEGAASVSRLMPSLAVRSLKSNVSDYLGSHGCVRLT